MGVLGFMKKSKDSVRCLISFKPQPFEIHQDKYMDYFYAQDVGKVIEYLANNLDKGLKKDYNLCYDKK